jgi:hypothetical protein
MSCFFSGGFQAAEMIKFKKLGAVEAKAAEAHALLVKDEMDDFVRLVESVRAGAASKRFFSL